MKPARTLRLIALLFATSCGDGTSEGDSDGAAAHASADAGIANEADAANEPGTEARDAASASDAAADAQSASDAAASTDSGDAGPTSVWPQAGASCGQLGRACDMDQECNANEACHETLRRCLPQQLSVSICRNGTCGAEAPYCVALQCITLEQGACICAHPDSSRLGDCKEGPEAQRTSN